MLPRVCSYLTELLAMTYSKAELHILETLGISYNLLNTHLHKSRQWILMHKVFAPKNQNYFNTLLMKEFVSGTKWTQLDCLVNKTHS